MWLVRTTGRTFAVYAESERDARITAENRLTRLGMHGERVTETTWLRPAKSAGHVPTAPTPSLVDGAVTRVLGAMRRA